MIDSIDFPQPDGRIVTLMPLTFGRARIAIGDGSFIFDSW